MQKEFKRAIQKASIDASRYMSVGLRREARASGWPRHIVNSLRMNYSRNGFDVSVHNDYHDSAMDYEYGNTEMRPTAAIRRFVNRSQESEAFFLNRAAKHMGIE